MLYCQRVTFSKFLQRKACFELITKYKPKVFVSQVTRLEEKHIEDQRNFKRMVEEQMRTQRAGRGCRIRSKGKIDSYG